MKLYINILLTVFMFVTFACSYNLQKDKVYTPPSVKVQPRFYYPRIAQEKLQSGTTKVVLNISGAGTVDRVDLKESSGFDILDKSAIEYCKDLVFNPARVDGKAINSRIEWELKFNFSEKNWNTVDYVEDINELLLKLNYADKNEKSRIQDEILSKHNEYIQNMIDIQNFNSVSEKVLSPEISREWKTVWNAWPLSFLLYHDFINRFNDYKDTEKVKLLLKASVKSDMHYIISSPFVDMREQGQRDNVLMKIRQFIKTHYPDIELDDLGVAQSYKEDFS